jgi:competence protein ComFB
MARVFNYMEDIVADLLEEMLKDVDDSVCKCSKCRLDIMALALNKLPPRYVVTEKGRVYAKVMEMELQFKADVAKELTKALAKVKGKPQH